MTEKEPVPDGCIPRENDYDDSPVGYTPCDICGGFMPFHMSRCTAKKIDKETGEEATE